MTMQSFLRSLALAVVAILTYTAIVALLPLRAQTLTVTIKPAAPFQITWDQDTSVPQTYRWWCDNAIVKNFTAAEVMKAPTANADGTFALTATAPGLPAGTHSCFVSAVNDVGESKSMPIPIVVGTAPATPLRLKVVVNVGGGQ